MENNIFSSAGSGIGARIESKAIYLNQFDSVQNKELQFRNKNDSSQTTYPEQNFIIEQMIGIEQIKGDKQMQNSLEIRQCLIKYPSQQTGVEEVFIGNNQNRSGTCWAHAISTLFYLATQRIYKREGGHPSFEYILADILGAKCLNDEKTLKNEIQRLSQLYCNDRGRSNEEIEEIFTDKCKKYRLRWERVSYEQALKALKNKRSIYARFYLDAIQWDMFSEFYKQNPDGILTKKDLVCKPNHQQFNKNGGGHCVVLADFGENYIEFHNSWGEIWGIKGSFRVQDQNVLGVMIFIDVFWHESDLTSNERNDYYKDH